MIRTHEEHLAHYGILRRSGRYPWGSGNTQSQRNKSFLDITGAQRKSGMSEAEVAKFHGISVADLRASKTRALAQQNEEKYHTARRHRDDGWGYTEIGRRMNMPESSVRALLARGVADKNTVLQTTSNMLRDQVNEKSMIDVGMGVEKSVGVNRNQFDTAISMLKEEGYKVHNIKQAQVGSPGQYTNVKILAKPELTYRQVSDNRKNIRLIDEYSDDGGRSFLGVSPPISVSSRRIKVNWAEDGGNQADGMIYVRPGVKDLAIGNKRYGQVRVMVDKTHYIKGMAVYKDDLPDGVDLVFNTKQPNTGRKKDAMKEIKDDPDNPFGAIVRQVHDPKTGKVSSAMNIVGAKEGAGEEGGWDTWSKNLPSQMLSKQKPELAKQQLGITYDRRQREFDEIMSLTNPTVRKDLLLKFADQTDAASVHLKAASLPRQATKVILPVPSMKEGEVYAPTFRDGERVALIRFPHGGTFEIPQLTVNNRNREARKMMGTGKDSLRHDAIGIHHKVAERLSGADFDGDTVLIIPNKRRDIKSTPALEGLKGFDPMVYKLDKDSPIPRITNAGMQKEMGKVSNLITDMTLQGADTDKMARAIRHSMVVIDSEKHQLNYRQSEKDNGIPALKEEYQGGKRAGAATIISLAKSPKYLPQRTPRPARRGGPIDPVTGKKVYEPTGRMVEVTRKVTDPVTGKKVKVGTGVFEPRMTRHKRLAVTEDAHELSSGLQMEVIYADHSNKLKAMANDARKAALPIKGTPMSSSAKKAYAKEVESLNAKIDVAEKNAPRERQAQRLAQDQVTLRRQANPDIEQAEVKKIKQQALNEARTRTGAKKDKIRITQSEWDAIQAGALSTHKLEKILANSDADTVKILAMPKHIPKLTGSKLLRAQRMLDSGYTQAEVADALGMGLTTLKIGLSE